MVIPSIKPRLVFFQYQYNPRLPAFLLAHKDEHARCLSHFFDVTVVRENCDYQEVCDKYQPDLALFESGVPNPDCRRLTITNTRANPQVAKLGFLHSDGFCCGRAGFLSDMDHWEIESFVAIAATAPEHLPEIAGNLFVWPNFADPEIYRDYGQWKSIPVLFTGNKTSMYPWRRTIVKAVADHYPSMICPHPGYAPNRTAQQAPVGEAYARMLNSAWFVPACGTVAKEVVRKHFEIPASNACLIAEKSPGLTAAGFADMENCVFADAGNVIDKLDYLFRNPDTLNAIIASGHHLVHSTHTPDKRSQILQWLLLKKMMLPHQRIVQGNPFSDLTLADASTSTRTFFRANGDHLLLLKAGDQAMRSRNFEEAERLYLKALSYIGYMPEPKVRLALCSLYRGDAKRALSWVSEPLQFTLAEYGAADPDPVEWAIFIVTLLALGRIDDATRRSDEFPSLHHPHLDYARRATACLSGRAATGRPVSERFPGRRSLHDLPPVSYPKWVDQLSTILRACGKKALADRVSGNALTFQRHTLISHTIGPVEDETPSPPKPSPGALLSRPHLKAHTLFGIRSRYRNTLAVCRTAFRNALHRAEDRYRYFLPYRLSRAREDAFFRSVEELAGQVGITSALVIGAHSPRGCLEALLAGARSNPGNPSVYRLDEVPGQVESFTTIHNSPTGHGSRSGRQIAKADGLLRLKELHRINRFDLIMINSPVSATEVSFSSQLCDEMSLAQVVLLHGVNAMPNFDYHASLLRQPAFLLKDHNPDLHNGYSIFTRNCAATGISIEVTEAS